MSTSTPNILCIGRILLDIIVKPVNFLPKAQHALRINEAIICPGGSAVNTALGIHSVDDKNETPVSIFGTTGDDILGDLLINKLNKAGIEVILNPLKHFSTSFCFVPIENTGIARYIYNLGADTRIPLEQFNSEEFKKIIDNPWLRHIHLGGLNLLPELEGENGENLIKLFSEIKNTERTITISVDTSKVLDVKNKNINALKYCDILFTTHDEAYSMTEKYRINEILETLSAFGPSIVILKLGDKGSCLYSKRDNKSRIIQTYKLDDQIQNLNGAGDIYSGVFLYNLVKFNTELDEIPFESLTHWCSEATEYAVEFMLRSKIGIIENLKKYSDVYKNNLAKKTDTQKDDKILPIQEHFETSDYNYDSLYDATIPAGVQNKIVSELTKEKYISFNSTIVDLCCGGAWLPIRLALKLNKKIKIILCDKYNHQLKIANKNVTGNLGTDFTNINYFLNDAINNTLDSNIADYINLSFAIHLFDLQEKELLASEMCRICKRDGYLGILTYNAKDLERTLFHTYIEDYFDIDKLRYINFDLIIEIFERQGFMFYKKIPFDYSRRFNSVNDFMNHVYSKPFSTFSLLESKFGKNGLEERLKNCEKKLKSKYKNYVNNKSTVTLLIFKKIK